MSTTSGTWIMTALMGQCSTSAQVDLGSAGPGLSLEISVS